MNKIDMLEISNRVLIGTKRTNRSVSGFRTDRSGDTTAFSGFDGAAFREVAQHTLRLPPQEGRLRSRFISFRQ